ncbi:MAG: DUF371 domain-containing protein [Archaeoglobaceae archaeon]
MIFEVRAFGHPNITAKHPSTVEVTKDPEISKRADCVIGVKADKSISDLPKEVKEELKKNVKVEVELLLPEYGIKDCLIGFGSEKLILNHERDIVIRKSTFICGRTLLISANKSAKDIRREMAELLKDRKTELVLLFKIED